MALAVLSLSACAVFGSAWGETAQGERQAAAPEDAQQSSVYEAKATTFGCNSMSTLADLRRVRADKEAFDKALFQQMVYGECIAIAQGQVVDGSPVDKEAAVLRVGAKVSPPGFMAPSDDFQIKSAEQSPH